MKEIQEIFSKKKMLEYCYDRKMQEFFELNLGSMTMQEDKRKLLELRRYVIYTKDEKVKI